MTVFKDISYGAPEELFRTLDIYLPQKEHFDVFLYFHGGGFVCGDKADVGPIADYLTARGIAVVSTFCVYQNFVLFHISSYSTATI